jgi:hypothetical protein
MGRSCQWVASAPSAAASSWSELVVLVLVVSGKRFWLCGSMGGKPAASCSVNSQGNVDVVL